VQEDPKSTYTRLLQDRHAEAAQFERRHRLFGYLKLGAVALAVVVVAVALAARVVSILWALIPLALFVTLFLIHLGVLRELERRRRAAGYFERGLARLDGKWAGHGETGERYLDPHHPYALDLDLFGKGSLFELISTARTHIGEDTLARWLLAPADPESARERQAAVQELRPRIDLREDLAVLAEEARTGVDPVSLAGWGEAPSLLPQNLRPKFWAFRLLGIAGFAALWVMLLSSSDEVLPLSTAARALVRDFLLIALLGNGWFLYHWRKPVGDVVSAVEEAGHELRLLSEVLVRLEKERWNSPLLARLRAGLEVQGEPVSKRLARLNRILEHLESRDNVFVRILEIFVLWTPFGALAAEEWRRTNGPAVRQWLDATGQMEALCSFASHAFEHPQDPFAEFAEGPACLEGEAIGHPLLAENQMVRNAVRLGGEAGPQLMVVSGSNMSGKSTMLRTVGVNAVLAQAGAPVRARRLRLTRLAIGASIRVNDSLQGGVSRFYAEILRIRQILDLASGNIPALFLIDEFLHGTNSHDRRIGAEALVRGLVERGAVGLITTHDLALADITEVLGGRSANVHFEDRIEDGKIHFDYVMRPGVVRKSNALELMRSVGLEI
jgi:hypothetical protein